MALPITSSHLDTTRLRLSAYTGQERAHFVALNTDEVVRAHMDGPLTTEQAHALFARFLPGAPLAQDTWAIWWRQPRRWVGHIFATFTDKGLELGFMVDPTAQGLGVATEAGAAVLSELARRGHTRVVGTVDDDHLPSIRVLEKLGFVLEAVEEDDEGPWRRYAKVL